MSAGFPNALRQAGCAAQRRRIMPSAASASKAIAGPSAWAPPILKATARSGEGIVELVDAIDRHQEHLRTSEHAVEERRLLAERQVVALARAALHREALVAATANGALAALVEDVATRTRDPRSAAEALLVALREAWTQAGKTRG